MPWRPIEVTTTVPTATGVGAGVGVGEAVGIAVGTAVGVGVSNGAVEVAPQPVRRATTITVAKIAGLLSAVASAGIVLRKRLANTWVTHRPASTVDQRACGRTLLPATSMSILMVIGSHSMLSCTMMAAMELTVFDPQSNAYSQASLVSDFTRLLFISGQVPESLESKCPDNFEDQCCLVWGNVIRLLTDAAMEVRNLVKVTVYLSDRKYREANARIRHEILGDHTPALTVIITGIYDPAWMLEIEAIAAA